MPMTTASAPISGLPQFLTPLQHEVLLDQHQLLLDQQQQLLALSALQPQLSHAQALQAAYLQAAPAMQVRPPRPPPPNYYLKIVFSLCSRV